MESKYDLKFEEMKKYIPFLESMIKRLESTSSKSENPRQAQLDKIRSLRDLLLDKKKRMKMENLLKCEQVLINLYTKVEQKDTLPGINKALPAFPLDGSNDSEKEDLNLVRNKLKNVASKEKLKEDHPDTLPEIARASETEVICTPGSKEPALFQRRPNKGTVSPLRQSSSQEKRSPQKSVPKRNYTRVLLSPDRNARRWAATENQPESKPLFSRRSPRRSPRRYSPSYHKKERKKTSKRSDKPKDLNITLNVPEESLNSLNTEDILSRIINCSDGDVDITTLRDLRSQILGELKQTGAKDDISDLILKSYKKKKNPDKKEDVEEGELSDSESEAIESIYGSLVLLDKDKSTSSQIKTKSDKEKQARKIQICLVINSDKESASDREVDKITKQTTDNFDFEMFYDNEKSESVNVKEISKDKEVPESEKQGKDKTQSQTEFNELQEQETTKSNNAQTEHTKSQDIITTNIEEDATNLSKNYIDKKSAGSFVELSSNSDIDILSPKNREKGNGEGSVSIPFKANFYKPMNEPAIEQTKDSVSNATSQKKQPKESEIEADKSEEDENKSQLKASEPNIKENTALRSEVDKFDNNSKEFEDNKIQGSEIVEIPLLNEPTVPAPPGKNSVLSEIDILQALKNEILSDSIIIPGGEAITPPLHQPKITKVANAQAIMKKKRISIEKYKEKSIPSSKPSLYIRDRYMSKEDYKKQSLKLTEKECERFNFPAKLSLDESSDEEDQDVSVDDIYRDLAPKSPENDDSTETGCSTPIIIPTDPVKATIVSSKTDVDMRKQMPMMSPNSDKSLAVVPKNISLTTNHGARPEIPKNKNEQNYIPPLIDPRVRRELNKPFGKDSPSPQAINSDKTPRPLLSFNFTSISPSMTPSMTPNMTPSMTSRTYEMTPSHQMLDSDELTGCKHVYAPIALEPRDYREMSLTRECSKYGGPIWEPPESKGRTNWNHSESRDGNNIRQWEDRGQRDTSVHRDSSDFYQKSSRNDVYNHGKRDDYSYSRFDGSLTPINTFGRSDCPATPTPSFGRQEAPLTPVHQFGRSDYSLTPSHPFGRSEVPTTPNHHFGRSDGSSTPSHAFGRSERPVTPSHSFGRTEGSRSSGHPFSPMTPTHSLGRSDFSNSNLNSGKKIVKDPRLNRSDYESNFQNYDADNDRGYYQDRSRADVPHRHYNKSDSYRNYSREQSVGRNDRNDSYDQSGRLHSRDSSRREPNTGQAVGYESERFYNREHVRQSNRNNYRPERELIKNQDDVDARKSYQRSSSIGRSMPSEDINNFPSRASNTGINSGEVASKDNKLSVRQKSGRSFTIDTSVNRTFQEFLNGKGLQVFDYSIDARKQRATSVGRSLGLESKTREFRESSVGRTLAKPSHDIHDTSNFKTRNNFRRARSVGRDVADCKPEKSFKDIKADFAVFSADHKNRVETQITKSIDRTSKLDNQYTTNNSKQVYSPRKNYRDPRVRREQNDPKNRYRYEKNRDKKNFGIIYSNDNIAKGTILNSGYAVRNYKIPKIKRVPETKSETEDSDKVDVAEKKENKLTEKRKIEDTKNKDVVDNKIKEVTDKSSVFERKAKCLPEKSKKQHNDNKADTVDTKEYNSDKFSERKIVTRSSKKSDSVESKHSYEETDEIIKPKNPKKSAILDSDSDLEDVSNEYWPGDAKNHKESRSSTPEKEIDKNHGNLLDSSFGLDLEIFTENISSPVIDNINALIADLDKDLDTSKSGDVNNDFSKEISFEIMLKSISSPEIEFDKDLTEESLNDLSDVINEDLNKSKTKSETDLSERKTEKNIENKNLNINESLKHLEKDCEHQVISVNQSIEMDKLEKEEAVSINDKLEKEESIPVNNLIDKDTNISKMKKMANKGLSSKKMEDNTEHSGRDIIEEDDKPNKSFSYVSDIEDSKINNDAIVSTTNVEIKYKNKSDEQTGNKIIDRCSTPDSTINETVQNKSFNEEDLPDSTNEMRNLMHSDVSDITSTHNGAEPFNKDTGEPSSSSKESVPQINSIGNLLSILQDKSKIKELLSMLDDHTTENEKIKKKLEKLSEIVSEDDDTNDAIDKDPIKASSIGEEEKVLEENKYPDKESDNKTGLPIGDNLDDTTKYQNKTLEDKKEATETNTDQKIVNNVEMQQKKNPEPTLKHSKRGRLKMPNRRTKRGKWKSMKKPITSQVKRVTRSEAGSLLTEKLKKPSRELKQLQEDIKEMFLSDDILNATGIRMCRLAKLVDDKNTNQEEGILKKEVKPIVVIEKIRELVPDKPPRKKPGPKPKPKILPKDSANDQDKKATLKCKPGPKSKTRLPTSEDSDPYAFESDSISEKKYTKSIAVSESMSENNTIKESENSSLNSSDSENESLASFKSFGSSEVLAELKKKPKRKRRGWQAGVIKPSKRRKKNELKQADSSSFDESISVQQRTVTIPDMNCFTDKKYCFLKNVLEYSCRLCMYSGTDIVNHYKKQHPHSEIPLSRMNPAIARDAIEQCEKINFQAISRIPTDKYNCRFCFKEFKGTSSNLLETFFWHVVSTHTGEYKQLCSECINVTRCPFNLDIPAPPRDVKGQLIGYICGKCNFTQISLENLKTHVIVRHNDEQTEVYTINLAMMSKKGMTSLIKRANVIEEPRILRSSRSNQSVTDASDGRSVCTESTDRLSELDSTKPSSVTKADLPVLKSIDKVRKVQSRITFENEDNINSKSNTISELSASSTLKVEQEDTEAEIQDDTTQLNDDLNVTDKLPEADHPTASDDILDYPHFKIRYTATGTKEYVCCINGKDNHYKTTLLISMKRHIQTKHSENWDGYCFVCKVIVTTQGEHNFKECLQHLVDKHMDNFPILEEIERDNLENVPANITLDVPQVPPTEKPLPPKPNIKVRPLSDLLSKEIDDAATEKTEILPRIEKVVSLGPSTDELSSVIPSVLAPVTLISQDNSDNVACNDTEIPKLKVPFEYEEAQSKVMSKKHQVVLESMMAKEKLVKIFKCSGRYCSFTSDSAEDALLHASTHQRVGGNNSLVCAYCNFDCAGNAIDLVMHVFKNHGHCQYVCPHCFYRAAASQLVRAHMLRIHGESQAQKAVLQSATVTPMTEDSTDILSRTIAVPYYICVDAESKCRFKSYIQEKFCEHLAKHQPPYLCYICDNELPNATDLVKHMKSHGLKVYQCTWCVHGSDNETELLTHASSMHPSKQPQAYTRIITKNKDKMMVLPLVQLNKLNVPITEVTPTNKNENPIREAERSIELEALIGSMDVMSQESNNRDDDDDGSENVDVSPFVTEATSQALQDKLVTSDLDTEPLLPEPPRLVTPAPKTTEEDLSLQLPPVLKTEPCEDTPVKEVLSKRDIICLDSDEEEASPSVINLSDDEIPLGSKEPVIPESEFEKIPLKCLFKCPKCSAIFKTLPVLKRHVGRICYTNDTEKIKCAHCTVVLNDKDELYIHYSKDHEYRTKDPRTREGAVLNTNNNCYACGICNLRDSALFLIKKHVKKDHGVDQVIVKSQQVNGDFIYTVHPVRETPKAKQLPKRKFSSSTAPATPVKRKRYSPQEVDQLPTKPILDDSVFCSICEFNTKVRLNMVRHLQFHADQQPVPQTVPVNPVPHLETNEKHFDKMVNLASSSIVHRGPDKPSRVDNVTSVNTLIPPETASRYPKYVSERQRHTCGAKGCSYISVDIAMLKCHWETLHDGTNDYHCVHCPPYQHLDTSKPLTASRIIAHLKMHDVNLYACSSCSYYHYKRQIMEKHIIDHHNGSCQVLIVREESTEPSSAAVPQPCVAAPTMDLKPWQCGLCKFKSMLRQEVIEHCAKVHNTKMQFKCPNCPYRASTLENVSKHKSNSHPESKEDIFYYYYREGSVATESDGATRWMKQRQKMGIADDLPEPAVKTETLDNSSINPHPIMPISAAPVAVNLNIVKKETCEPEVELSIEELCKKFGQFCAPDGLKYKCPLCNVVMDDARDIMQSHLYEELKYRKWGCSICSYKAFHKTGLKEHMSTEHRANAEPLELPLDTQVEKWVFNVLEKQAVAIQKNKENLSQQKIQTEKPAPTPSTSSTPAKPASKPKHELEQAFGPLGTSKNNNFCCPKCDLQVKEESTMQDHLEGELNQIRWSCSNCTENFQKYHEAQLHCKSVHPGLSARPVEAIRDPALRTAWIAAVIRIQKLEINATVIETPAPEPMISDDMSDLPGILDNSLLVVRYEKRVPTPEEEMLIRRKRPAPTPVPTPDSDDEKLVIDEASDDGQEVSKVSSATDLKKCQYCNFQTKYHKTIHFHTLRHFNLKPLTCNYCDYNCHVANMHNHHNECHPDEVSSFSKTPIPSGPPLTLVLKRKGRRCLSSYVEEHSKDTKSKEDAPKVKDDGPKVICLVCEKSVAEKETQNHVHDKTLVQFAKKGDVVVKCCICLTLFLNVNSMQEHQNVHHPTIPINYAYFKLHFDTRENHRCDHCEKRFRFLRDLKSHHNAVHNSLQLKYTTKSFVPNACDFVDLDDEIVMTKECEPKVKRFAKKSTTKLPNQTVAKKSTTKLPLFYTETDTESDEEFSFYGDRPRPVEDLANITTRMPVYNTKITYKQLSEIIPICPEVVVKDIKK